MSISGVLAFKKAETTRQAYLSVPADRVLFETDAPYLSPEPVRNKRPNEPAYVAHTIRFATQLRGQPFDPLAAVSTANAMRFFRLTGM